jgi:hypothetical protein
MDKQREKCHFIIRPFGVCSAQEMLQKAFGNPPRGDSRNLLVVSELYNTCRPDVSDTDWKLERCFTVWDQANSISTQIVSNITEECTVPESPENLATAPEKHKAVPGRLQPRNKYRLCHFVMWVYILKDGHSCIYWHHETDSKTHGKTANFLSISEANSLADVLHCPKEKHDSICFPLTRMQVK